MLYVDDAHGTGVLGASGGGILEHFALASDRLIYMGTLSKAYGAIGGFIAASPLITEIIRIACPAYGFTSTLPPDQALAVSTAIDIVRDEPERRRQLWDNQHYFVTRMAGLSYQLVSTATPIVPILVGPADKIAETAKSAGLNLSGLEIIDVPHSHAAAEKAVALVREGRAEVLMKGSLHTDELLGAVVSREKGLRTGRRISHAFLMDVPTYHKVLIVTDAAINIAPTLEDKLDICQNAIDLAISLGVKTPKVAILAAVETVTSKMTATLDAAALCKMADRGQITGGVLDGPLAFDNAIDPEAARIKGISSAVAGRAQILVVPDLEAGNMLAKNLSFLAKADAAGLVLGARVPVILTSRADSVRTRMASCAVAVLFADARRRATVLPAA
jgi:phosphotransacetylase